MIDDAMAKERPILHEAEHDIPPGIRFIWFLLRAPRGADGPKCSGTRQQ
jgi:hypothetical protein